MPYNIYPGVDEDYKFPPLIRQGMALYTELVSAFAGKYVEQDLANHKTNSSNPHAVTKAQVGLSNVDNTSDSDKPISSAAQTELNLKAPLASPAFTGTPTGLTKSHVGLSNVDNTTDANKPISTATQTALNGKAPSGLATSTVDGLMPKADKAKLDRTVPDPFPDSIMGRDSWGRSQIADPVGGTDVVNVQFMDSKHGIGEYVSVGSKANASATGQEIADLTLVSAGSSTAFPATPGAGKVQFTKAGVYAITVQIRLFNEVGMTTTKPVTGRTFIDIIDDALDTTVRVPIPTGESQGSAVHTGLKMAANAAFHISLFQTTGAVAYYRARIWVTRIS